MRDTASSRIRRRSRPTATPILSRSFRSWTTSRRRASSSSALPARLDGGLADTRAGRWAEAYEPGERESLLLDLGREKRHGTKAGRAQSPFQVGALVSCDPRLA